MKTIAGNVVIDRCNRCGRLMLLDVLKDHSGRQIFVCKRCTSIGGMEGLRDPLKNMSWIKK